MTLTQSHRVAGVAIDKANRSANDFYPTPTCATEALLSVEKFEGPIWEPACGDGAISKVLESHGHEVFSFDLVNRGYGVAGVDFLTSAGRMDNIVTNPPFKQVAAFIRRAVAGVDKKAALLLRLACLEGRERKTIFESTPLARVWVFSWRVPFKRPGWKDTGAGGMTAFAWFVWDHSHKGPPTLGWI